MSGHSDAQTGIADVNYSRFLNSVSAAREQSVIKSLRVLASKSHSSLISMWGGVPNSSTYLFKKASITIYDGSVIEIDEDLMKIALDYSLGQGIPALVSWLKDLQILVHNPPTVNYSPDKGQMELCITNGGLEGLSKVFEMLVSPGDNVLVGEPIYEGALTMLRPLGCNIIGVPSDDQGINPQALKEVLSKWRPEDVRKPESRSPKFLYTVPTGGNPIGITLSTERKKAIYQIAREYDFLIIEDDPYYYLQFTKPLVPSFLSMDVDGRVLRTDSMSKVVSPGLRIGFLTGPKPLIHKAILHMESSSMHVSAFTQVMTSQLLYRWGQKDFLEHTDRVAEFYRLQRDAMLLSADKWLTGLAEWQCPNAGMFLWIKIKNIQDTENLVLEKAFKKEVLLAPGNSYLTDRSKPCPYVRASFSTCSPEQIDKGFQSLAMAIKEEITSGKEINGLSKEKDGSQ
ncbi:kynurenine/alpha-aminoadipate aminotransferase, mitochondrial-like [Pleurodeles waltl]|uniref:kynurenine/alpha-aminoadipate aminotransferase, mitochondrial-like n=1 Tax=Pleurodeles waltl TaxID=8319 RepID=UPI0037099DA4